RLGEAGPSGGGVVDELQQRGEPAVVGGPDVEHTHPGERAVDPVDRDGDRVERDVDLAVGEAEPRRHALHRDRDVGDAGAGAQQRLPGAQREVQHLVLDLRRQPGAPRPGAERVGRRTPGDGTASDARDRAPGRLPRRGAVGSGSVGVGHVTNLRRPPPSRSGLGWGRRDTGGTTRRRTSRAGTAPQKVDRPPVRTASTTRTVVTPTVLARSGLGWGAVLATALARPLLAQPLPGPALVALLAAIVAVILVCAWRVVGEAEHLARRLGDPYGTLVLTLSIVAIEVILISAVMLGPGDHPTIARDSVTAVSMIILNLVVGVALVTAGARHPGRRANRAGVGAYLVLLAVLLAAGLALPGLVGRDGALSTWQAVMVALLTAATYVWFLVRQTGRRRRDFQEVTGPAGGAAGAPPAAPIGSTLRRHRAE